VRRVGIGGMPRTWCVCGLVPHDSGKTWLSIAMAKALERQGLAVAVAKPVAGHSAWFQRATLRYSEETGILLGEDLRAYMTELGIDRDRAHLVNPVDLLLAPPSAVPAIQQGSLSSYVAMLEDSASQIVMARVPGDSLEPRHYLVRNTVSKLPSAMRERILRLARKLQAEEIDLSEFLSLLRSRGIEAKILKCVESISLESETLVVESFNDALVPIPSMLNIVDAFVMCAVGSVAIYRNSEALRRAIKLEMTVRGDEALRAQFALSRVKPVLVTEIDFANTIDELASARSIAHLLESLLSL